MSQIVCLLGGTATDVDRFRALADKAIAVVEAEPPGTLVYECYIDATTSRFAWHEAYATSAALVTHVQGLMSEGVLQQLPEVAEVDLALALGDLSAEAREVLGPLGFRVLPIHAKASR